MWACEAWAADPAADPPQTLGAEVARRPEPLGDGPRVGWLADGGFDAWTGGGGPAVAVGASVEAPGDGWASWGWARLELVDDPTALVPLDGLGAGASARLSRFGGVQAGVAASAAGSVAVGWGEGAVSVDARAVGRWGRWGASLAGGGRGADVGGAGFGRASVDWRFASGLWAAGLGATLTGYIGAAPPVVGDVSAWLGLGRPDGARVELAVAAVGVPDSASTIPAPGLPPPGTVVGRAAVAAAASITRHLDARIEVAPELARGAVAYERVRAMVGVRVRVGRRPPSPPSKTRRGDRGELRFVVRDRRAGTVELLAEFAGWAPIPLVRRGGGRWWVNVAVPPGRWQYAYRVDGAARTPPEAAQRVDDGFGGQNGVVVVR